MSIKLILARLQTAWGSELQQPPVLLHAGSSTVFSASTDPVNLVVGYNASDASRVALDLGFCIAHQMRLAAHRSVVMHVVHVLDPALAGNPQQMTQADLVLWRVRSLAEEWRGSFTTHLRFGKAATELMAVMAAEQANLLILGCRAADQPLMQQFPKHTSFPILGIPPLHQEPRPRASVNIPDRIPAVC
jgi:nucleotide-binding universal stress UspA family protein